MHCCAFLNTFVHAAPRLCRGSPKPSLSCTRQWVSALFPRAFINKSRKLHSWSITCISKFRLLAYWGRSIWDQYCKSIQKNKIGKVYLSACNITTLRSHKKMENLVVVKKTRGVIQNIVYYKLAAWYFLLERKARPSKNIFFKDIGMPSFKLILFYQLYIILLQSKRSNYFIK